MQIKFNNWYLIATMLLCGTYSVNAASGQDVVFDNGWVPNNGFGRQKSNTLTSSDGSKPALTVKAGTADIRGGRGWATTTVNTVGEVGDTHLNLKIEGGIFNSSLESSGRKLTNDFHGDIDKSGGTAGANNSSSGELINNINGKFSISDGPFAMSNLQTGTVINTFADTIDMSGGNLDLYCNRYGTITNIFHGEVNISGGASLWAYSWSSNPIYNTFHGDVSVTDGSIVMVHFISGGEVRTQMNNLSLNANSAGFIGGTNSITTISDTLTFNGGELAFYRRYGGGFGAHTAKKVSVTAPSTISIVTSHTSQEAHPIQPAYFQFLENNGAGEITLLTMEEFVGNSQDIKVLNKTPFIEVYSSDASPQGLVISGTELKVNARPVATAESSDDLGSLSDATLSVVSVVSSINDSLSESDSNFKTTQYQHWRKQRALQNILQQRGGSTLDKISNVMMHLAKDQDNVKIAKFKGSYRVWLTPYFHAVNSKGNRSYESGFKERYYGMMFGGSHYLKDLDVNVRVTLGVGLSHRDNNQHKLNNSNGKHAILGLSGVYNYVKGGEITSSLYSMYSIKNQSRYAQPDTNQSYLAKAKVASLGLSWMNEINYVYKFDKQNSIRPNLGLYLGWSRRIGFRETNVPTNFAQKYATSINKDGEIYTGLGFRHKFSATDTLESKITTVYEIGYKSGNGRSTSGFSSVAQPNVEAVIRGKNAGRVTHYLNLYGSVLNKENNLKIVPGITAALQSKQTSITATVKIEYRF